MKVELEAKNIIIDGIDVFDHIGKVEKEANELVQRINKAVDYIENKGISCLYLEDEDLLKILKGVEDK